MNDKEFADYLEADIETRYEIHKAAYFKQYPESNIEKFHRFETAYLKRQIEKYNTKETVAIKETEIHINQIEVLEYIQNLKIAPLDYRFSINSDFWEQERTKLELASFQSKINNEGFLNVEVKKETVKIYNPQLAVILTSNELPAKDLDTQAETTIDSCEYLKTFVAAYKEGEQYFETTFKVSPEIMFGAGAKNYVNEIHMNFFHLQHRMNEGWVYVKKAEPLILTHKAVKEYGYYSGLVNKVEQLIIEHPRLFAEFEKCEHNIQPQQVEAININESRTKELIADIISSMDNKGWEYAFVSEHDYNLFADLLTNYFELKPYKLPDTTIQLKRGCKTKLAKALGDIHKELSNENKLSTDTNFFKIIRTLNHFEKDTQGDLYKSLTR